MGVNRSNNLSTAQTSATTQQIDAYQRGKICTHWLLDDRINNDPTSMSIPNQTENIPDRLHVTGNDPIYIDNIIILYIVQTSMIFV